MSRNVKILLNKPLFTFILCLHRIPQTLKLRRLWIRNINNVRIKFKPNDSTRVCSVHFKGGTDGPKPWCNVPTIFPSKPSIKSPMPRRPLPQRFVSEQTNNFEDYFHDYTPLKPKGPWPSCSKALFQQEVSGISTQTEQMETRDIGIQVCLPSLTAEDFGRE